MQWDLVATFISLYGVLQSEGILPVHMLNTVLSPVRDWFLVDISQINSEFRRMNFWFHKSAGRLPAHELFFIFSKISYIFLITVVYVYTAFCIIIKIIFQDIFKSIFQVQNSKNLIVPCWNNGYFYPWSIT